MIIKCKKCSDKLNFGNCNVLRDIENKKIGVYCNNCIHEEENKLKESRFVEEYKGNKIYQKNGDFRPYWGCNYCFKSIEDVKARIDNPTIGIYYGSETGWM